MKRVLFVTNHPGFSKFNKPYMEWFKSQGWIVDNASPGAGVGPVDNQYNISIHRSPFSFDNIKALFQLRRIINKNKYDLIHCHTEMGGVCGRLAAIGARKKGTKVIYTSHNYPFYKGSGIFSWLVFFTIEKCLYRFTDAVVAINSEDYELMRHHKMALGKSYMINGVGVDLNRFSPVNREEKILLRSKFKILPDNFVILYTAQFIPRKNHIMLIKAVPALINEIPNLQIVFAGSGELFDECKQAVNDLGLKERFLFLGERTDMNTICRIADIHVSTSKLEGQGINNIEAMACGCPLVVSRVRGHKDVCIEGRNGFLFDLNKPEDMISAIIKLYNNPELFKKISEQNKIDAQKFSVEKEVAAMAKIYKEVLGNNFFD